MDVDMYVDSLHSTDFHAWERGNILHGLPTQLCNVVWALVSCIYTTKTTRLK